MMTPVILLADKGSDNLHMLRLALLTRNLHCDLRHVTDGQEAVDYLNGTSQYGDRETFPFPAVTILEFQLPCRSGLEVLGWVRKHNQRFKDHPVLMLGEHATPFETQRAAPLATKCFEKTGDFGEVVDFLETILPRVSAAKAA